MIRSCRGSHLFYLKDNKSSNNFLSTPIHVSSGVPQGDHISPLLFLLFINDVSSILNHSKILLFADDAKIYKNIQSLNDSLELQSNLDNFCNWCSDNGMELNLNKCSVITFSQKKVNSFFNYNLNNCPAQRVSLVNDLGIFFDTKLKFIDHIHKIKNKASSKLGFLKRCCSKFNNPLALKNIYFSLVRSQLEYAPLIWSPNSIQLTQNLESIQNSFLRFLSFKCRIERQPHSGYDGVLGFFDMTSLKTRRNYLNLNFLFKLLNYEIDCKSLLENLNFNTNPKNTRNNNLFFLRNTKTNYSLNSPANMIMSLGNLANLDLFHCSNNDIKQIYGLI